MNFPFKRWINKYLYFTKRDRNALIVLIILIVLSIILNEIIKHIPVKSDYNYFEFAQKYEKWKKSQLEKDKNSKSLFKFNPNTITEQEIDSLQLPDFIKGNLLAYRKAGGNFSEPSDLKKLYGMNDSIFQVIKDFIAIPKKRETTPIGNSSEHLEPEGTFDPNTADKSTLRYFGFNQFQSDNLIRYKEKGGEFRTPKDLVKIYGIDSLFLDKIKSHIIIETTGVSEINEKNLLTVIDINSADSFQLTRLEGIGAVFASRIIKYRDLLGGFYTYSQLFEVYGFPEETYRKNKEFITVDSTQIKKIRINFAQYDELVRHPYLDRKKVSSLLKYRDTHGMLSNISELKNIPGFDDTTIKRLKHYITCR